MGNFYPWNERCSTLQWLGSRWLSSDSMIPTCLANIFSFDKPQSPHLQNEAHTRMDLLKLLQRLNEPIDEIISEYLAHKSHHHIWK